MSALASQKPLFLIDAFAIIFRAHFAFIKNPRLTSTGMNTSAVFGFTTTLLEVLTKEKPEYLGVAFDTSAPTFRHTLFEKYKAQRQETPEDVVAAVPFVKRLLRAMAIPVLEVDGYEADDVVGTLALKAANEGFVAYMMTPDKDYAQLVRQGVLLYRPASKFSPLEVLDREGVFEKFGVWPEQMPDLLGLKGDSVDNIPGVPKIGDKTALELLKRFGSLNAILEAAPSIEKKAVRETLVQNADQGRFSKELATIQTDVPIAFEPERLRVGDWDRQALLDICRELEFKTLGQRLLELDTDLHRTTRPFAEAGSLFAAGATDAAAELSAIYKRLQDVPHDYTVADSADKRAQLVALLSQAPELCFDTETTSLDALQAELVGLSFSIRAGTGWYVPVPPEPAQAQAVVEEFRAVLETPGKLKIGQNIKYDFLVLTNYGVFPEGPFYDTMLAHYVCHADGKHGMDDLARHYLNYQPISITDLIGPKGKKQISMQEVPLQKVADYAAEDADITLQLRDATEADMAKHNTRRVFAEVDMPVMPVLARMEHNGIRIDPPFLQNYSEQLTKDIQLAEQRVWEAAGERFNINSPKQLGELIFDKLKLEKGKKTKTGQYSTDEQTLTKLAATGHPLPVCVLEFRQLSKLKSTYVDALPTLVNPRTGLIHTSFNQAVAVTGRLSSNNPNLQNIPIRTERGREVRKAFIPRSQAFILLSADYSQIELRIMAAFSQDPVLLEAFRAGQDVHAATASRVFGVPLADVSGELRRRAKMVNFGMIYGITAFGLSERLGVPRAEGKEIHDNFFRMFPAVKAYMDDCVNRARVEGFAQTLLGRRQYLRDINSGNQTLRSFAERNAINMPIQGTAADMIKLAMLRLDEDLRLAKLKSKLVLQVHDELVLDAHRDELEALMPLVETAMAQALPLQGVPVEVGMGTGENWLDAH